MPKQAPESSRKPHYSQADIERQAGMLANRVYKNFRHFHSKFRKQNIEAFRLYHWDIPEIRAVIDWYNGHIVIGEYVRQQTEGLPWLETMAAAVGKKLNIPEEQIHLKKRRTRPKEGDRYQRLNKTRQRIEVRERELSFLVNLDDFVDTGLFADHRETRQRVRSESQDKHFLNLFAYTGSFTCYAALGGASTTTSVDTSSQYLQWAADNLQLNQLADPKRHHFVVQDAFSFLQTASQQEQSWDLIVIDPPSYSIRPGQAAFDIQVDHHYLLRLALKVLSPGGKIYFSTNHQRFEPDFDGLPCNNIEEITRQTIPEDFRRRPPHRCFQLSKS